MYAGRLVGVAIVVLTGGRSRRLMKKEAPHSAGAKVVPSQVGRAGPRFQEGVTQLAHDG